MGKKKWTICIIITFCIFSLTSVCFGSGKGGYYDYCQTSDTLGAYSFVQEFNKRVPEQYRMYNLHYDHHDCDNHNIGIYKAETSSGDFRMYIEASPAGYTMSIFISKRDVMPSDEYALLVHWIVDTLFPDGESVSTQDELSYSIIYANNARKSRPAWSSERQRYYRFFYIEGDGSDSPGGGHGSFTVSAKNWHSY